jgi:hypothetical protein
MEFRNLNNFVEICFIIMIQSSFIRLFFACLLFFGVSCNTSLKHFSNEPIESGVMDTLRYSPEVIIEGVKFLFKQYEFTILKVPETKNSNRIMIGEFLSTRLNESREPYPSGAIRIILEPLEETNAILVRARWFAPLRKGYEEKKKQQEELYQKKFLNELVFHVKHHVPIKNP